MAGDDGSLVSPVAGIAGIVIILGGFSFNIFYKDD